MIRIEKYASEHPEATVTEYLQELHRQEEEEKRKERERIESINKTYTSMIGKCFVIKPSACCSMFLQLDVDLGKEMHPKIDMYIVFTSSDGRTSMSFERNRYICLEWFSKEANHKEIPEEVFNDVVNKFNYMNSMVENIRTI